MVFGSALSSIHVDCLLEGKHPRAKSPWLVGQADWLEIHIMRGLSAQSRMPKIKITVATRLDRPAYGPHILSVLPEWSILTSNSTLAFAFEPSNLNFKLTDTFSFTFLNLKMQNCRLYEHLCLAALTRGFRLAGEGRWQAWGLAVSKGDNVTWSVTVHEYSSAKTD